MSLEVANQITKVVLYEGFINRERLGFGGLYPKSYVDQNPGAERSELQSECLIEANGRTEIDLRIRFLHLLDQDPATDEACEREIYVPTFRLKELLDNIHSYPFAFHPNPSDPQTKSIAQEPIFGKIDLSAKRVARGLVKLRVRVSNTVEEKSSSQSEALLRTMIATHILMEVKDGRFLSLMDPPEKKKSYAQKCKNEGVFPVLVGPKKEGQTLLSSPILLYDYPEVVPEGPADIEDLVDSIELIEFQIGDRVRILSKPFGTLGAQSTEVFNLALAGLTARVEGVEHGVDGSTYLTVTFEEDFGKDFGQPGHRFFFKPHEVERL